MKWHGPVWFSRVVMLLPALALALLASPRPADAFSAHDDRVTCSLTDDPAATIEACTRIIDHPLEVTRVRARAYINRGFSQLIGKRLDDAIADFTSAIALERNSLAYSYRGMTWLAKDQHGRAIADYTRAIRIDPRPETGHPFETHVNVYYERAAAQILRKSPRSGTILADLDRAIRLDGSHRMAFMARGVIRHLKGDRRGAEADLATARRLGSGESRDAGPGPVGER